MLTREISVINTLAKVLFTLSVIIPLSPLSIRLNLNGNFVFVILTIALSLMFFTKKAMVIPIKIVTIFFFCFTSIIVLAIYWQSILFIQLPFLYFLSICLVLSIREEELFELLNFFIALVIIICCGAIIQFFYTLAGGSPVDEFIMKDGRPSFIFPTGITNYYIGNFSRPAGVFDEPGTLAIVIAICVSYIEIYKLSIGRFKLLILLFAGVLTFSLAFYVFLLLYLAHRYSFIKSFLLLGVMIGGAVVLDLEIINTLIFSRLEVESGSLAGDNRTEQLYNALVVMDFKAFIVGLDPSCIFDRPICYSKFGYVGENPLAPLAFGGILYSFPFYMFIMYLAYMSFFVEKYRYIFIALALLLLQRPYLLNAGYSLMFFTFLVSSHSFWSKYDNNKFTCN